MVRKVGFVDYLVAHIGASSDVVRWRRVLRSRLVSRASAFLNASAFVPMCVVAAVFAETLSVAPRYSVVRDQRPVGESRRQREPTPYELVRKKYKSRVSCPTSLMPS